MSGHGPHVWKLPWGSPAEVPVLVSSSHSSAIRQLHHGGVALFGEVQVALVLTSGTSAGTSQEPSLKISCRS